MSFLVAAALAVGLLFVIPALAHLLRRGQAREIPFPPALLVPAARSTARQRRRLEDRLLLALRVLTVLLLAVLGATPFVSCSRMSLARNSGASVALALVLDDSLSMRARLSSGRTRHERAIEAARQLLSSARSGDAVAIVLAGKPARLYLSTTTDLGAARKALAELEPSDRSTDLAGAVTLAQSALADQPHTDKRVVVLSDLAGDPLPESEPAAWVPLPELGEGVHDCAVTSAERRGRSASITVACTTPEAATGRSLHAVPLADSGLEPSAKPRESSKPSTKKSLASAPLAPRAGLQVLSLDLDPKHEAALVLSGDDAIEEDDSSPLAQESSGLSVAVNADPTRASARTGGATLLEQALRALGAEINIKPISVVPEDPGELAQYALLLLDDPPGLTPEARASLVGWLEQGGTAVAFVGPNVESVQLGTTLQPFVFGAARWQTNEAPAGADPQSLGWLGAEARSLDQLRPKGRTRLDLGELDDKQTELGRWQDGKPFLVERRVGRGVVYTLALPTSVELSDFSLRPGFLALLDYFVEQAARRAGPRRSTPGTEWMLGGANASVLGPAGALTLKELPSGEKSVAPALRGVYRVSYDKTEQLRVVAVDPGEVLAAPRPAPSQSAQGGSAGQARVDASSDVALVLVALLALELLARMWRLRGARRAATGPL
ncbi:MAG TPA: VWA domain-containing protein [Polyangiaceae bacterium]|nr:VWA domain-containing protein [Polyangiaceae bacterium]